MNNKTKIGLGVLAATVAAPAMAIPLEVTTALTDLATEVATYTGPAVVLAVGVSTAVIAITWTKRFINTAK